MQPPGTGGQVDGDLGVAVAVGGAGVAADAVVDLDGVVDGRERGVADRRGVQAVQVVLDQVDLVAGDQSLLRRAGLVEVHVDVPDE